MRLAVEQQAYPYIMTNRRIAGGSPIIKGTRIAVRTIAGYYQMGMSVDEILNTLQHLSPSQVHSALAYYFDHQQEIDEELEVSTDVEHCKKQVVPHPRAATKLRAASFSTMMSMVGLPMLSPCEVSIRYMPKD